ncbi:4-fold beta flower protein [Phenylobacterium montanum]|uniref:4-fold beta flower protein n=1 Tax=Phenylobacterium montanum TaxID=2823693 RepID=UPI0035E44ADC
MEPLYGRSGEVYAWLEVETGRIISLRGKHIAFLGGDSVYSWSGRHLAWWYGDHARDHGGKVVVFTRRARGLGPVLPILGAMPARPQVAAVPPRPARGSKPGQPEASKSWAQEMPF